MTTLRFLRFALCLILAAPVLGQIPSDTEIVTSVARSAKSALMEREVLRPYGIEPMTPCYAGTLACGATRTGRVSVDSCESDGFYGVGYSFTGTQGQRVTISGRSAEFQANIFVFDGRAGNDTMYAEASASGVGQTATLNSFALPRTGDYIVIIMPRTRVTFGDYTLTMACTSEPPPPPCTPFTCIPDASTACMLGGRFKTTMTWTDPFANVSGSGRVISIAGVGDDQTFWSMYPQAPNNIELVVRMVDGGGANGKFWTSAAGFAVAGYTVTIQDTRTCNTWTRTVPANSSEIVKDANALPGN